MRSTARAFFGLLVTVLTIPAAQASTAVERTEADLIQESALIVTGHCTQQVSQWAGNTLVTLATIQVSEVLKGGAVSTVTVTLPGGVDANRRIPVAMTFPWAPVILQQENVLLFLTPQPLVAGSYSIAGFSQGKFSLVEDSQGKAVATQSLGGLKVRSANGTLHRGEGKSIPLDELRARIRETHAVQPPK